MDYIEPTKEFFRIKNLPRRVYNPNDSDLLAMRDMMTAWLKTPEGTEELLPIQALALKEFHDYGGFLGAIPVGEGKTHIFALAPTVVECIRPIMLVPAKHQKKKTPRHLTEIAKHWRIRNDIEIISYEKIGVISGKDLLFDLKPDLLLLDEMNYVKNRKGVARTKRIEKYIKKFRPKIIGSSGNFMDKSIMQGWHIIYWTFPYTMPLPRNFWEVRKWALAIEGDPMFTELTPGVLKQFCNLDESIDDGVGRRIVETPGLVAVNTNDKDSARVSLSIEAINLKVPEKLQDLVSEMRETYVTPGDKPFETALELWMNCRTLGCGYYNIWRDPPPKEWLLRRKEWSKMCRDVLKYSRKMETAKEVALAAIAGKLNNQQIGIYNRWAEIRPIYKPVTLPVFVSDYLIDYAVKWLEENERGLVWCELKGFSERLSEKTGIPYFCNHGKDKTGLYIEDFSGPAIVSPIAVKDGYNLQYNWDTNLIISCPPNNENIEQVIGRTHRKFQPSDEVKIQFVFTVEETIKGFMKMLEEARQYKTIKRSKLLYADYINIDIDQIGLGLN